MKSNRLSRLQAATAGALVLYALFFIYMFVYIPATNPMWNKGVAERRIQSATTLPELQTDLRSAVGNLSTFLHIKNELLLAFMIATAGMMVFLGWSLYMLGRLKREDSNDPAA
jgi:hypothetical protein